MNVTLETVDGSHLGRYFVKVVPLGDCSGVKKILCADIDANMHLNLY